MGPKNFFLALLASVISVLFFSTTYALMVPEGYQKTEATFSTYSLDKNGDINVVMNTEAGKKTFMISGKNQHLIKEIQRCDSEGSASIIIYNQLTSEISGVKCEINDKY